MLFSQSTMISNYFQNMAAGVICRAWAERIDFGHMDTEALVV
jgi:hypothetical protein